MTCIACTSWTLRGAPLRHHGFGICAHDPKHTYRPSHWECDKFAAVESDVLIQRQAWLAKNRYSLQLQAMAPIKEK